MRKIILFSLMMLMALTGAYAEPGAKREARKAYKDSVKVAEMIGAHRKGTKIKLNGVVLDKQQQMLLLSNIDQVDYNEDWATFRRQRHIGNGLVTGGSILIGAGAAAEVVAVGYVLVGVLVAAFSLGTADMNEVMRPAGYFAAGGLAVGAVGFAGVSTGIPVRVKADKKMKATCDKYNNASERVEKELIFGGTASGVGLSYRF